MADGRLEVAVGQEIGIVAESDEGGRAEPGPVVQGELGGARSSG